MSSNQGFHLILSPLSTPGRPNRFLYQQRNCTLPLRPNQDAMSFLCSEVRIFYSSGFGLSWTCIGIHGDGVLVDGMVKVLSITTSNRAYGRVMWRWVISGFLMNTHDSIQADGLSRRCEEVTMRGVIASHRTLLFSPGYFSDDFRAMSIFTTHQLRAVGWHWGPCRKRPLAGPRVCGGEPRPSQVEWFRRGYS